MPCSNDNGSGQALFGRLINFKDEISVASQIYSSLLFKFYLTSFERPLFEDKQLSK